jgi:hypothetical protein
VQFTTQTWTLPQYTNLSNPVLGVFNRDNKPDIALVQYNSAGDSVITTELNGKANGVWSNCPYPVQGRGISLCSPVHFSLTGFGFATSPVDFSAAAVSYGQIRKMELWVDGKKLSEQYSVWGNDAFFHYTATLAPGRHLGTIFAVDIDATLQKLAFDFEVGAPSCDPPPTDGVRFCSLSSNTEVTAAATVSGTLARMELWSDGAKEYTETATNYLAATLSLSPGVHRLTVVAVNTDGEQWLQSVGLCVNGCGTASKVRTAH